MQDFLREIKKQGGRKKNFLFRKRETTVVSMLFYCYHEKKVKEDPDG
jgi:hypothetical protein